MAFLRPPSIEGLDVLLSLRASTISSHFLKGKYNPLVVKKRYAEKAQIKKIDGLKGLYNEKLKPLERTYRFNDFASLTLTESDFDAKPMVMLLGQYSTGKINFIKHLLKYNYPGYCYCFTECDGVPKLLLSLIDIYFSNLVEEKDKKVKELQDKIAAVNFTPERKMGKMLMAKKELQDKITAVNFTPESTMGKMLMAKCRTLQEENEETGNQANDGKFTIRITTLHPNSNWLFLKGVLSLR
ncbi:EH domain-containing protein 1 [Capsicum baccatum]|uniref:EH domain-containing protein 1 n=1 Tax=Capsicum baccatum TaxID=33114 RepID=A0A2G2X2I6_CAPBA|nr:EH domain-containing protein 1 [Capsicum baccatum]